MTNVFGCKKATINPLGVTNDLKVLQPTLYSRLPYWCTSSCIVVIQSTLYISLNLEIVFITHIKGLFLQVPHFATSGYKSTEHFGLGFAYDAPKIWNDLVGLNHDPVVDKPTGSQDASGLLGLIPD